MCDLRAPFPTTQRAANQKPAEFPSNNGPFFLSRLLFYYSIRTRCTAPSHT